MEILRFIKWQWNRIHRDDKVLTFILLSTIICVVSIWLVGSSFIAILVSTIGTLFGEILLWGAYVEVMKRWHLYMSIKEQEAETIIRKLKGDQHGIR